MASSLKWRTGFGWPSLLLFLLFLVMAIVFGGVARIVFIVLTVFSGTWLGYKFYTYNGSPWRRLHFRGMLLYAECAGKEIGQSGIEGRTFNLINACRDMALLMCGNEKELFVRAMIEELVKEKGDYFAQLMESYHTMVLPKATAEQVSNIIETVRKIDFCPQLVIGNIIENTYGSEEAARYAVAVVTRQAY